MALYVVVSLWHAPGLAQLVRKIGMMSLLKDTAVLPEHIGPPVPPEPEPDALPEEVPEPEPEPELVFDPLLPVCVGAVEQAASETQAARERREKTVRGIEKTILSDRNLSRIGGAEFGGAGASSIPAPSALLAQHAEKAESYRRL
jgi:hypothetical protein